MHYSATVSMIFPSLCLRVSSLDLGLEAANTASTASTAFAAGGDHEVFVCRKMMMGEGERGECVCVCVCLELKEKGGEIGLGLVR